MKKIFKITLAAGGVVVGLTGIAIVKLEADRQNRLQTFLELALSFSLRLKDTKIKDPNILKEADLILKEVLFGCEYLENVNGIDFARDKEDHITKKILKEIEIKALNFLNNKLRE